MDGLTSTKKPLIYHDWSKEDYTEYRRKINREAQRKRRAKARENGYCVICAKNFTEYGYYTCNECLTRVKKCQSKKRRTK